MSDESLWIFGYGSLVWRPAFSHLRRRSAYINGYARRFWQGSTDHRGVPGRPGRVVTLLSDRHGSVSGESGFRAARCWGTAYEVPVADPDGVLVELDHRERGGYERLELDLFLASDVQPSGRVDPERARGLVYIAGPHNDNYLGPAPVAEIARQVAQARGPSGANPEYVFELARSLRAMGAEDEHVFEVADALRRELSRADRDANA
jgi:cation transport regulator ChaC